MSEFIPLADAITSFLLTYLMHSTLVLISVAVVLRCWTSVRPDLRVVLWKLALVLPSVTSIAISFGAVPQVGLAINIASAPHELAHDTPLSPTLPQSLDAQNSVTQSTVLNSDQPTDAVTTIGTTPLVGERGAATEQRSHAEAMSDPPSTIVSVPIRSVFCLVWLAGSTAALATLVTQIVRIRSLRKKGSPVTDTAVLRLVADLCNRACLKSKINVVESGQILSPLTGGIVSPFVAVPRGFLETLNDDEREALFAHELIHVVRRDNLWKLIGHLICRVMFMQPLNRFARHQLELDTEFVTDEQAVQLLNHRVGLAGCLCRLGEWLVVQPHDFSKPRILATGMASFRSTLGKRVETLLDHAPGPRQTSAAARGAVYMGVIVTVLAVVSVAPRAVADRPKSASKDNNQTTSVEKERPVKRPLTVMTLLAGLAMPAAADEQPKDQPSRPAVTKTTPDDLPDGIARFNGMLVGRLVKKDIEKGTFLVNVDAVPRVWRNSKAENPKSIVGKNVEVDGVFGKWLDALLVVKEGETLEFEAKHNGGNRLTFPGELLRKVAPFDPADYPELPEDFRGFHGAVAAKIIKKDADTFELIVEVERVIDTWKNNSAKNANSIVGKQMMLAGFWQRKDQYHGLKVGDRIEAGMQHIGQRSDHLTVAEFVRHAEKTSDSPSTSANDAIEGELPEGIRGFRGALVGRLVEKDVEKGTLEITVDAVPRIWQKSTARQPRAIVGKTVKIEGVSNRFLDVLLTTKANETLEVAAFHDRGDSLTFPGELFRKVGPYKAEDYPVLPDGFRGFQGQISAEIIKKDPEMYGLIIKVTEVKRSFENSRAKEPSSIEGQNAIMAGFWRQKEMYGTLKVGDRIEAGVRNETTGTDVVSVIEGVRKIGNEGGR